MQSEIIAAIDGEITKAKRRLDIVYNEVEDLKRNKTALTAEIANLDKHIKYLGEIDSQKETEIKLKQSTITGLDTQIQDRQKVSDTLQGKYDNLSTLVHEATNKLKDTEDKILEHKAMMIAEREAHSSISDELVKKHALVDEKSNKIKKLASEL